MANKIDIDRFICTLLSFNRQGIQPICFNDLVTCLQVQGLVYKDREIVEMDQPPLTEEQKPQTIEFKEEYEDWLNYKDKWKDIKPKTIKFNEPGEIDSVWPKEVVDELLEETRKNTPKVKDRLKKFFSNVFPTIYDIDIEKMVEKYKEEESKVLLPLGFSKGNIEHLSIAYKNGLEDMLKLIKEGGE